MLNKAYWVPVHQPRWIYRPPSPPPSTSLASNTPENIEEDLDDHEHGGGGIIQMEYPSD